MMMMMMIKKWWDSGCHNFSAFPWEKPLEQPIICLFWHIWCFVECWIYLGEVSYIYISVATAEKTCFKIFHQRLKHTQSPIVDIYFINFILRYSETVENMNVSNSGWEGLKIGRGRRSGGGVFLCCLFVEKYLKVSIWPFSWSASWIQFILH